MWVVRDIDIKWLAYLGLENDIMRGKLENMSGNELGSIHSAGTCGFNVC